MTEENDAISLQQETLRLLRGLSEKFEQMDGRVERLEQDRLMLVQRVQAFEQHAEAFVGQSTLIHKRLDDLVTLQERMQGSLEDISRRLDRIESQPVR